MREDSSFLMCFSDSRLLLWIGGIKYYIFNVKAVPLFGLVMHKFPYLRKFKHLIGFGFNEITVVRC